MRSLPSPARRFPFDAQAGTLPIPVPDCHLVRTAIPYLLVLRQPRCFPQRSDPVLILFCKQTFKEISPERQGHGAGRVAPLSRPVHARQATLHTAFTAYSRVAPQCRFKPVPYNGRLDHKGSTPLHEIRSPQRAGRSFHAIETRPTAAGKVASPQHPPQTGRKKQTPEAS